MNKPEVLAPAGDLERLKWALDYGADAVYIGGYDYSLRANANNFSLDDIKLSCEYAHERGKKVYVTVNMIFHNEDFKNLDEYLIELDKIGVDSLIVSDFGVISRIKELKIKTPFFISTQMSTTNYEVANFWKSLGAYRVVLARECSKEDIEDIKKNSDIEVETFIHGAMCTSYSGRCVMSNYVTLRDSNRGGCSQICRFCFNSEYGKTFTMSSKDLNMVSYIKDLFDLGVESFKIEGRMKSLYYIATVTSAYKNIVEKISENKLNIETIEYYKKVLNRCSNRENTPQFFDKYPGVDEQYFSGREEVSNQDFLGVVKNYDENTNMALIEQRNYFKIGDEVEIFGPDKEAISYTIKVIENSDGECVESAKHPQELVKINTPIMVKPGYILRVKIS